MGNRIELGQILRSVMLELGYADNVYFQPPETLRMQYPCIRYALSSGNTRYANNTPYSFQKKYTITVIDKDPDSNIRDRIAMLPGCRFDRPYDADNLHHFVFTIQF